MKLNEVVPWGRSFDEYQGMFDLTPADLDKRILGCGDGPASFNSELTARGGHIVSVDPLYAFSSSQIQQRIEETHDVIVEQVKQNPQRYVWNRFPDPDELGRVRLSVMHAFLRDFGTGLAQGRYLPMALPHLAFRDQQFELCLCSHLLFLYSEQLSLEFHLNSIQELLRVAAEVRIFPLLGLNCEASPHLEPVRAHFTAQGAEVEIRSVPYELQRGGHHMMVLRAATFSSV